MMTVGVGHSRRYCNTGYDQSQGRRPSTLKCIGPISKGDIEPNHPSEINPNSDSRSRSDGRSRRFVQYRVDQSQGQRPRSLLELEFELEILRVIEPDFELHPLKLKRCIYSMHYIIESTLYSTSANQFINYLACWAMLTKFMAAIWWKFCRFFFIQSGGASTQR